jgi:hypothetical protein
MDTTCSQLNDRWDISKDSLISQADAMDAAIDATFKIFGDDNAFRKSDGEKYEARRNRAVFDIMVYFFTDPQIRDRATERGPAVETAFRELCKNPDFVRTLETTTKSIAATQLRLELWGNVLRQAIDWQVIIPHIGGASA